MTEKQCRLEIILNTLLWLFILATFSYLIPQSMIANDKSLLAFASLFVAIDLLIYYLARVFTPKEKISKTIFDSLFIIIILIMSLKAKAMLSSFLLIPIFAYLVGTSSSMLMALLCVILTATEIFALKLGYINYKFSLQPDILNYIVPILLSLYSRLTEIKLRFTTFSHKQNTQKLAETHKRLSEIEVQGKEFTALAAQQISTPLATIQSFLQTVISERDGKLNSKHKQFLQETSKYTEKMHTLLNELLYISKIEFAAALELRPIDIHETINTVAEKFKIIAKENNIGLKLHFLEDKDFLVIANKEKMNELLERLLDNAVRYSPPKTEITLKTQIIHREDQPIYRIEISDQGYGIPEQEQRYIFKKFFRGTNIIDKKFDGNGLGLFIIKILSDRQNAKIAITSKENTGTKAEIDLPIEKNK